MWCVDEECMSPNTADVYVSRIRAAFENVFNGDYSLFELLAQAFRGYLRQPEICLKNLETASGHLEELIILMSMLPPTEFFESKGMSCPAKTLSEWVSAFSAYHRYYEWRIDKLRVELGIIPRLPDNRKERMIPLKKEFSDYLRAQCHYAPASVWRNVGCLSKLKYFFLDFLADDILEIVSEENEDWASIKEIFASVFQLIDLEIEMIEQNLPERFSVVLSVDEIKRGKDTLRKYRDFIKFRIMNGIDR